MHRRLRRHRQQHRSTAAAALACSTTIGHPRLLLRQKQQPAAQHIAPQRLALRWPAMLQTLPLGQRCGLADPSSRLSCCNSSTEVLRVAVLLPVELLSRAAMMTLQLGGRFVGAHLLGQLHGAGQLPLQQPFLRLQLTPSPSAARLAPMTSRHTRLLPALQPKQRELQAQRCIVRSAACVLQASSQPAVQLALVELLLPVTAR